MYRWTHHRVVDGFGHDQQIISPLSMWWVARAAAEETLQGGPLVPAWLQLFRTQLSVRDGYWFRWRGDFAESAELRRAYSGLYGRFVARALLTQHLQFSRFMSLTRNGIQVPGSINVGRNSKGDIPDWLAWDDVNSQFVLCEAKGSLTGNDFLGHGEPGCVRNGKAQFERVSCIANGRQVQPAKWVAATRWATETRDGLPITLLWDPPVEGNAFDTEEADQHREAMSRAWLDSIAPGLGWRDSQELLRSDREQDAFTISAEPGAIPSDDDWPVLQEDDVNEQISVDLGEFGSRQVSSQRTDNGIVKTEIQTMDSKPSEIHKLESQYLIALVTRFGVRPIRTNGEFDAFRREQERAKRLEEPSMLIGLPLDFEPTQRRSEGVWLDGAGIAPKNDLALFDVRRIQVSPITKTR